MEHTFELRGVRGGTGGVPFLLRGSDGEEVPVYDNNLNVYVTLDPEELWAYQQRYRPDICRQAGEDLFELFWLGDSGGDGPHVRVAIFAERALELKGVTDPSTLVRYATEELTLYLTS